VIFELDDSLFELQGRDATRLKVFFYECLERQHRITVNPPYSDTRDDPVNRWLDAHEGERDELEDVLVFGFGGVEDPDEISTFEVYVRANLDEDWSASKPVVNLESARRLVEAGLLVLMEDWDDDVWFVRTQARLAGKLTQLEQSEDKCQIRFDSFGGKDQILKRLREVIVPEPSLRCRTVVIFDSDARRPWNQLNPADARAQPGGAPFESDASRLLRARQALMPPGNARLLKVCEDDQAPLAHYPLTRRTIESYVPVQALFTSAERLHRRPQRQAMKAAAEAFKGLNPAQREHFNMKEGFNGDAGADACRWAGGLYDGVSEDTKSKLARGFNFAGSPLGGSFKPTERPLFTDGHLHRDGQETEAKRLVMCILEMV